MKKLGCILLFLTYTFNCIAQQTKQYSNPILSGFYPDPSIVRVGTDYYLVNSTFSYFPGIPVMHSKDLVNWTLIGHVITRTSQIDFTGKGVSRSIFAPTIRYHKGIFYVSCTMIDGKGNFVVTATNPAGPWSDPHWLPFNGIDPSLYFDEDDKCYITYNSIPPDNKSLYDGHRTIRINEFDYKNFKVLGENKILVNGGTDITKKPSWIEGPHIVKKVDYYYLISAEGGTGAGHSVVAFRSKNIYGPYESYAHNPILTQRHLKSKRKHPITSTGHADLVELPDGRWQAVFLGTRPYEDDYFNTGRETFLTPVEWKDEWPILNLNYNEVQYQYPLPLPEKKNNRNSSRYSGNFAYIESFNNKTLLKDWIFLRNVKQQWYNLAARKGYLTIDLRPETLAGNGNPSYIARRQQHSTFTASTAFSFTATAHNEKAGVACFINEDHFYLICKSKLDNQDVIELFQSTKNKADSTTMALLASQILPAGKQGTTQVKVQADGDKYSFYFRTTTPAWNLLKADVDGKFLSTKVAGGFASNFVGCTIGLYATSLGKASSNKASYDWFEYSGNDEVHK
jgi:xylan 1,4-beta-xylosidase